MDQGLAAVLGALVGALATGGVAYTSGKYADKAQKLKVRAALRVGRKCDLGDSDLLDSLEMVNRQRSLLLAGITSPENARGAP